MGFTCLFLEGERLSSIQKERKKQKKERKRDCSLLDFTAGSKRRVKTREFYRRRLEGGRERESLLALEQRGKEVSPEREGIKRKEEYFTCTVVTHPERNCFKRIVSRERENLLGFFFLRGCTSMIRSLELIEVDLLLLLIK